MIVYTTPHYCSDLSELAHTNAFFSSNVTSTPAFHHMSHSVLVRIAEMSTRAHLSPEGVDKIRRKVRLRKQNTIPMQRTCGYKSINRTTFGDILRHLKRFRFSEDAIR